MMTYGVYVKKATDDEPMYKNYDAEKYFVGEIVAVFPDIDAAEAYAKSFTGYSGNVKAAVGGLHPLITVGHNAKEFWATQLPKAVVDAWIAENPTDDADDE